MDPQPVLHIVGIEEQTSPYGFEDELPRLHNVFDLGDRRTGVIIESNGEDSSYLGLLEYSDGGRRKMHELQAIASAE
jgi:hypothetical protein